jgi:hypothetical protein
LGAATKRAELDGSSTHVRTPPPAHRKTSGNEFAQQQPNKNRQAQKTLKTPKDFYLFLFYFIFTTKLFQPCVTFRLVIL